MQHIKVKQNQSLFDIAIEQYGNVEGVFWLIEDNNFSNITKNVYPGEIIKIRPDKLNKRMVDFFKSEDITTVENARGKGIGYMRIEVDFKVK